MSYFPNPPVIKIDGISGKDEQLRTEFEQFKEESSASLIKTVKKFDLLGWELQNKVRELKPLVTFIDDDAYPDVWTKLKPLSEKYNIPFVVAAISSRVDEESRSLTSEQLRYLQNELGWEISSHTHTHRHLGEMSDEEQEYELRVSKEILESKGLKITTVCYPYGSRNENTHKFVRKYYRSGRTTDHRGRINLSPLETYDVVVTPLGSWFDTSQQPYPTNSLEFYKYQVDKAIEQNGWLIFMTHVGGNDQHDEIQQFYLEETIKYVIEKEIEIVTYDEGLNRRGNIVDIGRYYIPDTAIDHFVVGPDGSYSGSNLQNVVSIDRFANREFKTPKGYALKKVSFEVIDYSTATTYGFPENMHGNLITFCASGSTRAEGNLRQIYVVANSNNMYSRYAVDDDTWSDWVRLNDSITLVKDSVTLDSPLYSFPKNTVSRVRITTGTMPEGLSGVLTTDRRIGHDYYVYQTYEVTESTNVYRRYWMAGQSKWSDWKRITPDAKTTTQRNRSNYPKATGDIVYDTTLGKLIWWNGTSWVDFEGNTV